MAMKKGAFNVAAFTGNDTPEPESPSADNEEVKKEEAVSVEPMLNMGNGPAMVDPGTRRSVGRPRSGAEIRSKRCTFVLKPSVFDRLSALARIENNTVSDTLNGLVEAYVFSDAASGKLEKFNALWGQ